MRIGVGVLLAGLAGATAGVAADGTPAPGRFASVAAEGGLPAELARPQGRTRWDLTGLRLGPVWPRQVDLSGSGAAVLVEGGPGRTTHYSDATGGADVRQWLAPELDPQALVDPRPRQIAWTERAPDGTSSRMAAWLSREGVGWLHLPSGPREVVLQRAEVWREAPGSAGLRPDLLVRRFVDPRTGLVAQAWAPFGADGQAPAEMTHAAVTAAGPRDGAAAPAATGLRIYVEEEDVGTFNRLNYGLDVGEVTIDALMGLPPGTGKTMWDFACNPATPGGTNCQTHHWDFSAFNLTSHPLAVETASTLVPVQASETCSYQACGFTAADYIGREDARVEHLLRLCQNGTTACLVDADCAGIGSGKCVRGGRCQDVTTQCIADAACAGKGLCSASKCQDGVTSCGTNSDCDQCVFGAVTVNGFERVDVPGVKSSIFLRGVVRNEAETQGALGENESRVCYSGAGITPVPLWEYAHPDAGSFYMQHGDAWSSGAFNCELNLFNHVCGNSCGVGCALYTKSCDNGAYAGKQFGTVVNEGTVTLPSGHTFDTLVARNTAEFCVFLTSGCSNLFLVQRVRTVIYLWQVPELGTVVRLMSEQNQTVGANKLQDFVKVIETDIKYGLFPPRSITVGAVGPTSVELAWDPGLDTHRVDGYRVYWDTDSGANGYAFDSLADPGQVAFNGTSATISGLTPNTQYFFTVTAMSDYRYPANGPQETYESLIFPTQLTGGPVPVPAEVTATTAGSCTPTLEVLGLTAGKVPAGVEACWTASLDPCLDGYTILGSASPTSAGGFSVLVPNTGLTTCHMLTSLPPTAYFLVVGHGGGGTGPWGHYGM